MMKNLVANYSYNNSVFNFFAGERLNRFDRGLVFITNKQLCFYAPQRVSFTHNDLVDDVDKSIYPDDQEDRAYADRDYNAYIYLYKDKLFNKYDEFILSLPYNKELSMSQYMFICSILDEIDSYNKDKSDDSKIKINISTVIPDCFNEAMTDVKKIKEELYRLVTKKFEIKQECIVGSKLSDDNMKLAMLSHINVNNCANFSDLEVVMEMCASYFADNFYHTKFCELFPTYENARMLFDELKTFGTENLNFSGLTFENICDVLAEKIKQIQGDFVPSAKTK